MDEILQHYASRLLQCRHLAAATSDPVERAAYDAIAEEFVAKISDSAPLAAASAQAPAVARQGDPSPAAGPRRGAGPYHSRRLMLIDDQPEITGMLRKIAVAEGCEVLVENDSTLAFARLLEFDPHMIVLDLVMPNVDGIELLQKLRSSGMDPHVLVMSGYGDFYLNLADTLATGGGMRNVSTLAKPIRRGAFIDFLHAAMGR